MIKGKEVDRSNMIGALNAVHEQIKNGWEAGSNITFDNFSKILICGMGGSALPGEILNSLIGNKMPITIVKDYSAPDYINDDYLVIIISYSGFTEETLAVYNNILEKTRKILVMTSGGDLKNMVINDKLSSVKVMSGLQPRQAWPFMLFSLLRVLSTSKIINLTSEDINLISEGIENSDLKKSSEAIAAKIDTRIPLIYASNTYKGVAYKWKINFNENTKIHAFCNTFPELNHNELEGFEHHKGLFHVLILRDEKEKPKIAKRMDITKKLLKDKGFDTSEIIIRGRNNLMKIVSTVLMGDYISYYLAIKYGIDPTPVEMIQDFKKALR